MKLPSLMIFVVYKSDVNPRCRYRDSVQNRQENVSCCLPTQQRGRRHSCHGGGAAWKNVKERALGNDVRAYLLRSAFPSWHKDWICRQGNKLRATKPPVSVCAVSFQFHQKGGHSCENSKRSHSLGTGHTHLAQA